MPINNDDISGLQPRQIAVGIGATNAVLVEGVGGQGGAMMKYISGGSCMIVQAPMGISFGGATTWTGTSLIAELAANNVWPIGSEIISLDGAARFYLMATGATAVVGIMRGLTPGF